MHQYLTTIANRVTVVFTQGIVANGSVITCTMLNGNILYSKENACIVVKSLKNVDPAKVIKLTTRDVKSACKAWSHKDLEYRKALFIQPEVTCLSSDSIPTHAQISHSTRAVIAKTTDSDTPTTIIDPQPVSGLISLSIIIPNSSPELQCKLDSDLPSSYGSSSNVPRWQPAHVPPPYHRDPSNIILWPLEGLRSALSTAVK